MALHQGGAPVQIPAHVPPELVVDDFPLIFGASTTENPFQTIIPKMVSSPGG